MDSGFAVGGLSRKPSTMMGNCYVSDDFLHPREFLLNSIRAEGGSEFMKYHVYESQPVIAMRRQEI